MTSPHTPRIPPLATLCVLMVATLVAAPATGQSVAAVPSLGRVLVTNDDGIDSPGLHALARAFAEVAEVIVVAPEGQRSGSGMTSRARGDRELSVSRAGIPGEIPAYSVDGFPVDCVLFAAEILWDGEGPDLVISGINTVPNVGAAYTISGTVGAARMARQLGIPALAVSGGDPAIAGQLQAAARYAVSLAQSELFRSLDDHEYLTLDVPLVPPEEFRGVRLAYHQADSFTLELRPQRPPSAVFPARYRAHYVAGPEPPADSDIALLRQNYLVVVPMTVAEQSAEALTRWRDASDALPALERARDRQR